MNKKLLVAGVLLISLTSSIIAEAAQKSVKEDDTTNIVTSDTTVFETEIEKAAKVNESAVESQTISYNNSFSPGTINTTVGSSGILEVGDFEGIKITGVFAEVTDNPNIKLNADGTWEALKAGDTTLTPLFTMSEESLAEIKNKFPNSELIFPAIQQIIPVKVTAGDVSTNSISIGFGFTPNEINTTVGSSGKIEVADFEGVKLTGTFTEVIDNPNIKLNVDGTWEALKAGETTLTPLFTMSEESMAEIKKKYPDSEPAFPAIQQIIPVKIAAEDVSPKTISIGLSFTPNEINTTVGSSGKIEVADFEGIKLTGTFAEVSDNPNIQLNADGTWKALKVGETELAPNFTLSEESLAEIKKKYPDAEIGFLEIQQIISVKIAAETVGQNPPTNASKPLPQTGEQDNQLVVYGQLLLILSGILFLTGWFRKRTNKNTF